jgi:hypothetical protein
MIFIYALVVIAIILLAYYWRDAPPNRNDDFVLPFANKDEAADLLLLLNKNNHRLIDHLMTWPRGSEAYELGVRIKSRYQPNALRENDPESPDSTSYTEDKGRVLAICLRDPSTGKQQFHDRDLIKFVNLHELAHIGSVGWGHQDEFWTIFKFLLQEARKIGIYTPTNYAAQPVNYCGLDVSYNPLYDASLLACCT